MVFKIIDMTVGDIILGKRKRIPFMYLIKFGYDMNDFSNYFSFNYGLSFYYLFFAKEILNSYNIV